MNKENLEKDRIEKLKSAVLKAPRSICPERAVLWTRYFKVRKNRKKPPLVQMAEALSFVLKEKTINIYLNELIVGNYTSKKVGGSIFPELHGVPVLLDIFKFKKRKTNPLAVTGKEIRKLLSIIPFWVFRFMAFKAYRNPFKKIKLIMDQLTARHYLLNEAGGIGHIAPDYKQLILLGTEGIKNRAKKYQEKVSAKSETWYFYESVSIICDGLAEFGKRYSELAEKLAVDEKDGKRKKELLEISRICRNVPRNGATSFYEAVQSIFFAQIAINLESLDNGISPGRMDEYLFPFYAEDLKKGTITREKAKEILSCFSIKTSEIIPIFSEHLTNFHGGMFNGQVITIGGVDSTGKNSVNELSYIFLEIMNEHRMRQPNFHARISECSTDEYLEKVYSSLASGSNSPAIYNDEVIIPTMVSNGYSIEDARDYTAIGCVEPVSQGRSLSSTDAALFNVPVILEMALNRGRRFGRIIKRGMKTDNVSQMKSMEDVKRAFECQLQFQLERCIKDLQAVEIANRKYHPTPLTSMLIDGCLESGKCSSNGGAKYNFSGLQCVGPADTGDALYAIEKSVFIDKKLSLVELVLNCKKNFTNPTILHYLKGMENYGNDHKGADLWTGFVVDLFYRLLTNSGTNTRDGKYTCGLYSVTAHEYFGRVTGAMPNGRKRGEAFASGISPTNGADKKGPTAMLNSANRIDMSKMANGVNLNIKFTPHILRGPTGILALKNIIKTYFRRGGMQTQINVLDSAILKKARVNPKAYPNLLVRVSGYSAYFNDLTPAVQDEIIERSEMGVG